MQTLQYVPGQAVAIGHNQTSLLVSIEADHAIVDKLVAAIEARNDIQDILDILVTLGLRDLPDFALSQGTENGFRVAVRGECVIQTPTENVICLMGPWLEKEIEAESVTLSIGVPDPGKFFPFRGGVVLAKQLKVARSVHESSIAEKPHQADVAAPVITPDLSGKDDPRSLVPGDQQSDLGVAERAEPPSAEPAIAESADDSPTVADEHLNDPVPKTNPSEQAGEDYDFLFAATTMRPDFSEIESKSEPASAVFSPTPAKTRDDSDPESNNFQPDTIVDIAATTAAYNTQLSPVSDNTQFSPVTDQHAPSSGSGLITGMPWLSAPDAGANSAVAPAGNAVPMAPASVHEVSDGISGQQGLAEGGVVEERTINRSQLMAGAQTTATVIAARCALGHLSPAYAGVCRVCGQQIPPQQPFETKRPLLGVLRLSTGGVINLDRPAIVGRNPRIPQDFQGTEQPNLVQVVDPERDVSSQHIEISLDFWNVLIRDLGSTNGTEVILPGAGPVALRAGERQIIEPGTKVILGGTVSLIFEVTR